MPRKKAEVIVRRGASHKSRQWWLNKISKICKILLKFKLPKAKRQLLQTSTLCLLITRDTEIKKLNYTHRKKRKPTDVLSFHLPSKKQFEQKYLGDIVISTDSARKNVKSDSITIEQELMTLLIHGYLHLLGYDHITPKDAKTMFRLQNKTLNELGFYDLSHTT